MIFKSDGMPTYNFAVVVDDALKITHVIKTTIFQHAKANPDL